MPVSVGVPVWNWPSVGDAAHTPDTDAATDRWCSARPARCPVSARDRAGNALAWAARQCSAPAPRTTPTRAGCAGGTRGDTGCERRPWPPLVLHRDGPSARSSGVQGDGKSGSDRGSRRVPRGRAVQPERPNAGVTFRVGFRVPAVATGRYFVANGRRTLGRARGITGLRIKRLGVRIPLGALHLAHLRNGRRVGRRGYN
jgi:hypothetical protein